MYKLLIVEDEEIVRDYLVKNIHWGCAGIKTVYSSSNAFEGIKTAKEMLPDIIITDIKMQGMTGLEMIRQVREFMPSAKTIILSGYNNFDFAREAIVLKAYTYLLKPFEDAELLEAVKKAITELESEESERLSPKKALLLKEYKDERVIEKVFEIIENEYMEGLCLGELANRIYLSPNYLGQIFLKITGKTFNSYLAEFRMNKARELLKNSQLTLAAIATNVGIKDETYFCTLFKSFFGLTPGKYRKTIVLN